MVNEPHPNNHSVNDLLPLWPDNLQPPHPERIKHLLKAFWKTLEYIGEQLVRSELLLVNQQTAELRAIVLEMMLALNGIQYPEETKHLNGYLSDEQRTAIEKTMAVPSIEPDAWIGQAVSLVVIYRWYAPQLVEKYALVYPRDEELWAWDQLCRQIPAWPHSLTTEELPSRNHTDADLPQSDSSTSTVVHNATTAHTGQTGL